MGFTNLKWYIVGFGGDEPLIRQKIAEASMEDHVILLGKKENPYPYIKACDIYVQPSRYEGKSVTVREAQVLCKPVIVTSYPTARSQVKDGVDGVIVPQENEACARGMADAIKNTDLLNSLSSYLQRNDYGNEVQVGNIYRLL
jgi:glycosyltransferase involved in cell wall biosynthesis